MKFSKSDEKKILYLDESGKFTTKQTSDKDEIVGVIQEVGEEVVILNNTGIYTRMSLTGDVLSISSQDPITGELKEKKR